jgi:hypothetical protein
MKANNAVGDTVIEVNSENERTVVLPRRKQYRTQRELHSIPRWQQLEVFFFGWNTTHRASANLSTIFESSNPDMTQRGLQLISVMTAQP